MSAALKFFVPSPAMAYEPTPSSAITAANTSPLSASLLIPGLHSLVVEPARAGLGLNYAAGGESVLDSFSGDRELVRQIRREHRLDARGARAPVEPADDLPVLHEDERRHDVDLEPGCNLGARVDVHALHTEAVPLLALEVSQQALHSSRRARSLGREEHEQRPVCLVHGSTS